MVWKIILVVFACLLLKYALTLLKEKREEQKRRAEEEILGSRGSRISDIVQFQHDALKEFVEGHFASILASWENIYQYEACKGYNYLMLHYINGTSERIVVDMQKDLTSTDINKVYSFRVGKYIVNEDGKVIVSFGGEKKDLVEKGSTQAEASEQKIRDYVKPEEIPDNVEIPESEEDAVKAFFEKVMQIAEARKGEELLTIENKDLPENESARIKLMSLLNRSGQFEAVEDSADGFVCLVA